MKQYITTRYFGPGAVLGSRIKATASGKRNSITRPYPHEVHHSKRHALVAKELATNLGWSGLWVAGGSEKDTVYVCLVGRPYTPASDMDLYGVEGEDWFLVV
jgi:hypothetical protein